MKKLLVMCGSGIATSTIVTNKLKDWLKSNGLDKEVTIVQSKVASEVNRIDDYDAVVTTTAVPDKIKDKVISGLPILTGMGTEEMYNALKAELTK
ncbi:MULTISPECIES: PTS sugar transporter subunit IIB [Aerococcus]|jgi:PTS system galactitol-specific IIB component|uniref:PTS galactitol transporter subunit IIB n=1 Tax=Aerococcus agrisoli TaxID=2487350 RepID=A0A3N4GWQ7_9LACT|nr:MULTISPECIES: PTS sugar transporter subunit IIB [Aerococcus]OYQ67957.1 PTS galactitol transporter subunit IIB [Aerococcus sp. 1KP-2016]RPA57424.1 PTS galactitol transporter subunit IIB [Aerococcus agrisoli]